MRRQPLKFLGGRNHFKGVRPEEQVMKGLFHLGWILHNFLGGGHIIII